MYTDALRAEWTKLRTSPGALWSVVALAVAIAGLSALAVAPVTCPCATDTTKLTLTGVQLGQAVAAVVAVMLLGGEYGTRMITVTLAALPSRTSMLAAKATLVGGLVAVAGTVGVGGAWVAGQAALGDELGAGAVWRPLVGSVLYLVLIALFGLGVAAITRNSAAAVGVVLGLLYVAPLVTAMVQDDDWQERLQRFGPADAGLAVQATINLDDLAISPWRGLGVLALWTLSALLLGGVLLHRRDA
ncbi:ABC transporter permease subunit [Cryptosporangium aurantiacum]|uniref:ABC-2 type transport system permease protein n=1 Tax=Cryptosporangium aurantiacum TaxID=134849 RepID=A0A1M7TWR6_9ACTN|nr:ABC transporter permease subunit [Cryptosporangium aurantiacum]SHN75184.1 ABC-2 type transport system permease protein [Cryptosporangium aurantiacum]